MTDIREPLSVESLMADVQTITGFGWRRNGSPAARQAAAFFAREFESHGLTTTLETWPFNLYYPLEWSVTAADPAGAWEANSIPIWYSQPGSVSGEVVLVDARTGRADLSSIDVTGKIVIADVSYFANFAATDGSPTRDAGLYADAVRGGAVGYVRRAGAPGNGEMLMHFAQNFPAHKEDAKLGQIPAFTVGQDDFDRLAAAAASSSGLTVHLRNVLADVEKGAARTVRGGSLGPGEHELRATVDDVIGVLEGTSDEVVVVASHYDSTFDGAVDNATGNAVLLSLMRHYAGVPKASRPKTLVFLASGAHDTGDFDLYHFVEQHSDDILARTVAFNWLDHMAADASAAAVGNTVQHGVIAAENTVLRGHINRHMGAFDIPVEPVMSPASTISHLPRTVPSFNVTLAPSWYHSPEDTIDKVPPAGLSNMAAAQRALLDDLLMADGSELRAGNPGYVATTIADGVFFTRPKDVPRGRHAMPRAEVEAAQRERLLIAGTELLANQGYAGFGIREICKSASVSQSVFYNIFEEKEACIFAGYDRFIEVLGREMTRALSHENVAREPVVTFVTTYIDTLRSDLVTARAFQVELDSLGSAARQRRRVALRGLAATLRDRLPGPPTQNAITAAVYAVRQTVADMIDEGRSSELSTLIPDISVWVTRMLQPR